MKQNGGHETGKFNPQTGTINTSLMEGPSVYDLYFWSKNEKCSCKKKLNFNQISGPYVVFPFKAK